MSDSLVIRDREGFSWGPTLAGGAIAVAVTFVVLTLGSGVGLLFLKPGEPHAGFLTGGAIYFLVAQAFGFAVGGHVVGRLLGPLPESHWQEEVRAAIHGLAVWAVCVLATVVMVAGAGATTAALYGMSKAPIEPSRATAVIVDRLFRPASPQAAPAGDPVQARGEAARLIDADFAPGAGFNADDRTRLVQLVAEQAHASLREAGLRVAAMESRLTREMHATAEQALRTASTAALWIAFSLLFGALAAMVAAITARLEDDHQTGWTLFAFHRGWRS